MITRCIILGVMLVMGTHLSIADDMDSMDVVQRTRGAYRLELHVIGGIGATRYEQPPSRYSNQSVFTGYNGNVRLMWHPDHLLGIGIMTGYQVFSLERFTPSIENDLSQETKMQLGSVPIHAVFEMRGDHVRIGAGIGAYLLLSDLMEQDTHTYSSAVAYGGSAWLGYSFALSDRVRLGPDIVVQIVSDRGIGNLSAMLTLQVDLLSY